MRPGLYPLTISLFWAAFLPVSNAETTPEKALIPAIQIPAGNYILGSDRAEREAAYRLDEKAYGHSLTRTGRWYESERQRQTAHLPTYHITSRLVTNEDYRIFLKETDHRQPEVSRSLWQSYGLIHPFSRTQKFIWRERRYPEGREHHPVVLISWEDARSFAAWYSIRTGEQWQLPTEEQWEKAARGRDGRRFPWGRKFNPRRLNSHDQGPFDTMPVGSFPSGNSPFGMTDTAGQVFEWTRTSAGNDRYIVKGGSWDDKGCGVCRPAARHGRPSSLKHILIGFRLVRETP